MQVGLGTAVYLGLARLFGIKELRPVIRLARRLAGARLIPVSGRHGRVPRLDGCHSQTWVWLPGGTAPGVGVGLGLWEWKFHVTSHAVAARHRGCYEGRGGLHVT